MKRIERRMVSGCSIIQLCHGCGHRCNSEDLRWNNLFHASVSLSISHLNFHVIQAQMHRKPFLAWLWLDRAL